MSFDIAKGIYMCRKKSKLNKKEFAKLIGVSPETLSAYESGKSIPSVETVIKISEVMDSSIDEVMLLNYYVIITSNLSEYEEISIQYFKEHNKKKSKEFSKFINDCMDKTYAKKIEI